MCPVKFFREDSGAVELLFLHHESMEYGPKLGAGAKLESFKIITLVGLRLMMQKK